MGHPKETFQDLAHGLHELERELEMNLSERERLVSAVAATAAVGYGLGKEGLSRWGWLALGGALIYRAFKGRCPVYDYLDIDRRHGVRGVAGNRGIRVEHSVEIHCPAQTLYNFWRRLENLPMVMRHLESVEDLGDRLSHWKVRGPVGAAMEWDAEIINDHPGRMIAWQSLPGAQVENAGSVRFDPTGKGATRVKVAFEYDPPAGVLGAMVAKLFGHSPHTVLAEDLEAFKEFAERELAAASRG